MRLVVAMTGATGAALGIRLLEVLRDLDVETHLVLSDWARATIKLGPTAASRRSGRWPPTPTVPATLRQAFPVGPSAPTEWSSARAV